MSLTIEQELTKHELADERRFGQVERHLERIEGKIDVLTQQIVATREKADSASDLAEKTGEHDLIDAKEQAAFWKKLIAGILSALAIASISGLATWFVSHR